MSRTLGQWNAYVACGKSRAERGARLAEVPENLRPQVEGHVRTALALRSAEHRAWLQAFRAARRKNKRPSPAATGSGLHTQRTEEECIT